jgi:hypothetical protein
MARVLRFVLLPHGVQTGETELWRLPSQARQAMVDLVETEMARILLVVLALGDLALGVLLVAVSGFILQGVYNTGPLMPDAIFYVAFTIACFLAPLLVAILRKRMAMGAKLGIVAAPLAVAAFVLLISP